MTEQSRVVMSGMVGALLGVAAGYLFFTEGGRQVRERFEPALDDLKQEFGRFQRTLEKVGGMAAEGMRVVQDISAGRQQSPYRTDDIPH